MSDQKIKPQAKIILIVLAGAILFFGAKFAASHGWIPNTAITKALVPARAVLPDVKDAQIAHVNPIALPSKKAATVPATLIRADIWEWNAQDSLLLANGGAATTEGSLMAKRGVNLLVNRQDDNGKMRDDLIACAKELSTGVSQCSTGANFIVIMGDGIGQFAAGINPQLLKEIGPKWGVKAIGALGYSRGEDAFMAPPDVKKSAQNAKGLLVEGVILDGDWNIALKWAGDNGIPNNPTDGTYDPDAINWVNAPDYNTAASDYVTGTKCPDLKIVHNGRPTGETKKVCVNAIVTWLPGDATAANQRGGLVKIVSSEQYKSQMPAIIIGPNKFLVDNRDEIVSMLAAAFEAGDQIKAFDLSLHKASEIAADIYQDQGDKDSQNGDFWYKYFKGLTVPTCEEPMADGVCAGRKVSIKLGGSSSNNLDDNLILFGMKPGTNDNFRSTYTVFANIDVQQYPTRFKETPIPDVKLIEDKSYILAAETLLSGEGDTGSEAATPDYAKQSTGDVRGDKSYHIEFNSGSATLTEAGIQQLRELKDSLAITGLFIHIDGYTDNTGSDTVNVPLSKQRAESVRDYLHSLAPSNFPISRFSVSGHGSQDAAESNATAAGKAANRRVRITTTGN